MESVVIRAILSRIVHWSSIALSITAVLAAVSARVAADLPGVPLLSGMRAVYLAKVERRLSQSNEEGPHIRFAEHGGALRCALGCRGAKSLEPAVKTIIERSLQEPISGSVEEIVSRIAVYSVSYRLTQDEPAVLMRADRLADELTTFEAKSSYQIAAQASTALADLYLISGDTRHRDAVLRWEKRTARAPETLDGYLALSGAALAHHVVTGGGSEGEGVAGIARAFVQKVSESPSILSGDLGKQLRMVQFLCRAAQESGEMEIRQLSEKIFTDVAAKLGDPSPDLAAEALLAGDLLGNKLTRFAVVGAFEHPQTEELWRAGLALPELFVRRIRWDPSSGQPRPFEVLYPALKRPAAYVCIDGHCSLPQFSEAELRATLSELYSERHE